MRFRVAYDNEMVRSYVDQKIRRGESSHILSTTNSVKTVAPGASTKTLTDHAERHKRIAVLPFANFSPNPVDEYFSDGLTEELISTLSKIDGPNVISRTSVMRYKKTENSLSEIANELDVGIVLEGSVRKIGDDLRISAQLIDVENDEHLWSETYDRKFENIFSLQKEIAERVADSLKLSKGAKGLDKKPTQNMEAYIFYLKARNFKQRVSLESYERAIEYCERATDKDPNYAQAWAEIGQCYSDLGFWGLLPPNEVFPKAERFAERAIQLDDSIPESHVALGKVMIDYKWDFRRAEREFRRAVELNPSYAQGHTELGGILAIKNSFEESALECRRALELDPVSAWICLWAGTGLYSSGRNKEAIEALRNAVELDPTSVLAHQNLGCAYVEEGMFDVGISEIRRAIELGGGISNKGDLAQALARVGGKNEARKILAELLDLREKGLKTEAAIANAYVGLGEYREAIDWLEKAYENRVSYLSSVNGDPFFAKLRPDPRYQALMKKIGIDVSALEGVYPIKVTQPES